VYVVELDVVRTRHLWPRGLAQPPLTRADEDYLRASAQAEARRPEQRVQVEFDSGESGTQDQRDASTNRPRRN
jgi:hypothetical protein